MGHRAGAGRRDRRARNLVVGARTGSRRVGQCAARKFRVPRRRAAEPGDPRNRRSRRARCVRRLAGGDSRAAHARGARARARLRQAAGPLLQGNRGEKRRAAPPGREAMLPASADRGAVGPDLRARGRQRTADRGHPRRRGSGARRAASRADRASRPSASMFPTMWPARRSAERSRTCSRSHAAWSRARGSARTRARR